MEPEGTGRYVAEAFGVTLDFLVDETGAVVEVKDREMLNRITEINHLDQTDKTVIIQVIDSLLRDAKAKKAMGYRHASFN